MVRKTRNFKWGSDTDGRFHVTDRRTGMKVNFDSAKVGDFLGYGEGAKLERHVSEPGWSAGFLPAKHLPDALLDDLKHIEEHGTLASTDIISTEVN